MTATTDTRPCGGCGRYKPRGRYDTSQCRFCWLFFHDERYRRLWGGEGVANIPTSSSKPRMSITELAARKRH